MKKILLVISPLILAALVFGMYVFFSQRQMGKGALQVTANPKSQVFLNGKLLGVTPLCKCESSEMLSTGEYTVRLVPQEGQFSPFEQKVQIAKGILTVVDRTFGQGATSEGSIITLESLSDEKSSQLLVVTLPDGVEVVVDSNSSGTTPVLLKDISESDHEVRLKKNGYKEKIVRIRTTTGYKLNILAFLGIDMNFALSSPSANIAKTLGEKDESQKESSSSAKVVILQTPTGFLRVRKEPSTSSVEIDRVNPGDTFTLLAQEQGWYKITVSLGKEGWISSSYSKKQ